MTSKEKKDIWYWGIEPILLDDNYFDGNCELTIMYDDIERTFILKLVELFKNGHTDIEGKEDVQKVLAT